MDPMNREGRAYRKMDPIPPVENAARYPKAATGGMDANVFLDPNQSRLLDIIGLPTGANPIVWPPRRATRGVLATRRAFRQQAR
jgi:hypothetical protein